MKVEIRKGTEIGFRIVPVVSHKNPSALTTKNRGGGMNGWLPGKR